jgi:glycosyltransferase involved in cell wall biosynthesis
MKKLLIATTVPITLKAFLLPYAENFRRLGWRVDCLSRNVSVDEICALHFDERNDINWNRNPFSTSNLTALHGCVKKIRELAYKERYDIVHVHTPVAAFITRYALRNIRSALGISVIYTAHGFHFYDGGNRFKNCVFRMAEKIAARWTDLLVVMNDEDYEAAVSFLPPERVVKINGTGIDLEYYSTEKISKERILELRDSIRLAPSDKLFSYVAEFNPGKKHEDAIKALAKIESENIHLAFAGTGDLFNEMKALAEKLNIGERIHFLGFQNDVRPLIAASTAMIMPSEREGLPRSVMESMAMKTPIIGADIRGTRDLLKDGCGLLVPTGDNKIASFALAMIYCANEKNVHEINKITEFAYNRIVDFDIKILIKEHEELYTKVAQ